MRRAVSTSLVLAFLLALRLPVSGEEKGKARVDLFGDPLPEGALARLGTVRLRHEAPVRALAFTPDGKSLVAGGFGRGLVFWDVDSGKQRRRLAVTALSVTSLALSADGKVLAAGGTDGVARVLDVARGTERKLQLGPPRAFGATFVALSPNGKSALVATQYGREVELWDVEETRVRHRLSRTNSTSAHPPMAFTPDGKAFVLALDDDRLHVLDALTGRDLRTLEGSAPPAGTAAHNRIQALAISADGKHVAFGGRASNELVVLDLASGKEARRLVSPPHLHGMTHALAFTPNGRFLVEGRGNGVSVWGLVSGKLLRRFHGGAHSAPGALAPLALSPDGKSLALASGSVLSLRSLADGKPRHDGAGHAGAVGRLAFSADGKRLLSSGDSLRLWGAHSGKQLEVLPFAYTLHHLYPTRDGKGFRWVAFDRSLYEWRPGEREPRRLSAPSTSAYYAASTISPDGRFLAGLTSDDHKLWLLPLRENRPPRQLDVLPDPWSTYLTFSPDGRRLALVNSQKMLRVYDVTAAREPRSWPPEPAGFGPGPRAEFSPDGRSLLRFDGELRCVEIASGQERFRLPRDGPGPQVTAWSPDGRLLAWARLGAVVVHDTCTGREVLRRDGKQGRVVSLAFSPDGRKLATGGANTTILIWEVPGPPPVKGPLDRAAAWRDLAGDGARSFRAMSALLSAPDEAVALVRDKVRPQPPADPKRLAALVAELNDDSFEARERAEEELRKLGVAAEAALRQALKSRALEVRRRAGNLLAELEGAGPERLRAVRALEVLERARTPAARALLRQMAKAGFDSYVEGEIRASLERLGEK